MINWFDEFNHLYEKYNLHRLSDVPQMLKDFTGFEESFWMAATKKYGVPDLRPTVRHYDEIQSLGSARQRVIRMYAHYAPGKLHNVNDTLEIMRREGVGVTFNMLIKKYGEEPPLKPATFHERILVLYATHNALERINGLPALLASYEGMEDMLIRRLVSELGPEPHTAEAGDPRNPRERLQRIFDVYNPEGSKRIDLLLSRYRGNELALFATMQRQYGREPSEYDVQLFRDRIERDRRRVRESAEARLQAEMRNREIQKQKQQREMAKRMQQIGAQQWDRGELIPLEPLRGGAQRPDCIKQLRSHLESADELPMKYAVDLATEVFRTYDRQLVPYAEYLLQPRFDAGEVAEFFALLDCMYANALPANLKANLRTVVSLLEMKFGSTLEEVFVAGGVERFLNRIEPSARDEWAVYLTMLHGTVTESELAARNRLRAYYLQYNPGTPINEVDAVLKSLGSDSATIYTALQRHYGPEPLPIPIDMALVRKLLAKHDPDKVKIADVVVEAHCYVGDSADMVLKRLERTYGPRPHEDDDAFADLRAEEVEARFAIFATELRVRQVTLRRKAQLDFPELDVLSSIINGQPTMRSDETQRLEDDARLQGISPIEQMEAEELDTRHIIMDQRELHLRNILDQFVGTIDFRVSDCVLELDELLRRHFIIDDQLLTRHALAEQMHTEHKDLMQWLEGRLIWRAKWKRDAEMKVQKQKREEMLRVLAQHQPEPPPPALVAVSDEHNTVMERLNAELQEQANRVLQFNAAVNMARVGSRDDVQWGFEVSRLIRGDYHHGCVFHQDQYHKAVKESAVEVRKIRTTDLGDEDVDDDDDIDWDTHFVGQCMDYVRSLLTTHEPRRLPSMGEMVRAHFGKEHELIAALEQQYNVRHWREHNLRNRLIAYYKRIGANDRAAAEIPELLRRFGDRPEVLWEFLRQEYGANPEVRAPEVHAFLVQRLTQYLARHAPHRLREVADMIDRCPDYNCDSLFQRLTAEYGPEDRSVDIEVTRLKLLSFYKSRGLTHLLPHVNVIAKRFTGRPALLREVIRRKFNGNLDDCEIVPQDIPSNQ